MNNLRSQRPYYAVLALAVTIGMAAVLQFSGYSIVPLGKRYVANYYFNDLHAHHKYYFPLGKRLIILNGEPVDSIRSRHIVGVAKASHIVEYSSTVAIERFGALAQCGATEIIGTDAEWLISEEPMHRLNWDPAMSFLHNNVELPNRIDPGEDAILACGDAADTLYLGTVRYRYQRRDTTDVISLTPTRFFYVNTYKSKATADRKLFILRYGKEEATYRNVDVRGAGEKAYFHDGRVVAFSRWVDNTVSAAMTRHRGTGKINDVRRWIVNDSILEKPQRLSRVQATAGTVTYLNGVQAVSKYGVAAYFGAVEVVGNALKFFSQQPDTTAN